MKWQILIILLLVIKLSSAGIIINEFMPDPEGKDNANMPEGEWIELFNKGDEEINLEGYIIKDLYDTHELYISTINTKSLIIKPKEYSVVYRNGEGDFSLNNEGFEKIRLFDKNETLLDEVSYSYTKEGLTWNRINNKWILNLPTPNEENNYKENIYKSTLSIEKIQPNEIRFGDNLKISIKAFRGNTSKYRIKLYIRREKDITERISFDMVGKFKNNSLILPIKIPENCDKILKDGKYKVILSGLNQKVEKTIEIRGLNPQICKEPKKETIKKEKIICPEPKDLKMPDKKLLNGNITKETIYSSKEAKEKRLALYFFCLSLILTIIAIMENE